MVSIDGDDITGATIDGDDVTEITMDGDVVWTGETIIESFEAGNINAYSGSPGDWSVVQSPTPAHGTYAVQPNTSFAPIYDLDHANSPAPGTVWSMHLYLTNGSASSHGVWFNFGMQSADEHYELRCRGGSNTQLYEQTSGGQTWQDGATFSYESNAWNRIEILWDDGSLGGSNGDITITGYDSTGTQIGQISANNTTYGAGGIGFNADLATGEDAYADYLVL